MGHNKRPRYNADKPSPTDPAIADTKKQETAAGQHQANAKNKPGEKRFWGMNIPERIMAVLALAGVVIAALTGGIFWKQLKGMRTDQRAWISLSIPDATQTFDDGKGNTTVQITLTITNTGKTPAKAVFTQVVVEKVRNGESPEFVYENRAQTYDTTGTIFPNAHHPIIARLLKGRPHTAFESPTEPLYLTPYQYQDILDGKAYFAIYASTSYRDVFDTEHWLHFCAFASGATQTTQFTSEACTNYNDVDGN